LLFRCRLLSMYIARSIESREPPNCKQLVSHSQAGTPPRRPGCLRWKAGIDPHIRCEYSKYRMVRMNG
jgi:hypothetical protein